MNKRQNKFQLISLVMLSYIKLFKDYQFTMLDFFYRGEQWNGYGKFNIHNTNVSVLFNFFINNH